uniref:Uncharacterized protein n=1 Tax=Myotis myotis TaxID=51298 RepID=A0A7J7XHA5_MYOMY|nr:hypothetical protein mMyoMyo1_011637 [Myotis myotis]
MPKPEVWPSPGVLQPTRPSLVPSSGLVSPSVIGVKYSCPACVARADGRIKWGSTIDGVRHWLDSRFVLSLAGPLPRLPAHSPRSCLSTGARAVVWGSLGFHAQLWPDLLCDPGQTLSPFWSSLSQQRKLSWRTPRSCLPFADTLPAHHVPLQVSGKWRQVPTPG